MDKYREIKRNQIIRVMNRGCGIQLNEVIGCSFNSVDSNRYTFLSESLSQRYSPDRLTGIAADRFNDELSLYEHRQSFEEAHPNYSVADRLAILNTLSTAYSVVRDGRIVKYIFYIYMFGYTGSEESVIISTIMINMQPHTINTGLELNIVTHKNNISEALKVAKPIIDIGNNSGVIRTEINHVPVSTLTISPSRNVLSPIRFGLASNHTIEQITSKLKSDNTVFPDICINDPLVVENGWKRGDIIEFERSDGYIAYRRVTNSKISIVDIH